MSRMRTEYIVSLVNRVTGPARQITNALAGIRPAAEGVRTSFGQQLDGAIRRNNARLTEARGGLIDAAAGYYALQGAIGAPVRAAMQFESAMADVRKVVDFEAPEGFANMARDIRRLSKEIPISADGLAQIAAAAGEAGFAEQDILKVTRAAAEMGVAFGISAEAAGDALPNLMNAMGLTLDQAQLLADGINHLSNNMASGAPEVLEYMTRIGADSKAFGFAAEEAAAFGSAMIATGAESNVAATSFRNMGRALTRGASATDRQMMALESLGMSSEQVAEDMQRNAVGTTLDVIEALSRVPKEAQAALMNDLFGSEARALTPLLTNTDLLRQSLNLVARETEFAGSVLREYNVRASTFGNRVQLLRNRANDLGIVVGNALIPGLTRLMDVLIPVMERFGKFAEAHPELVANVTALAAGLIGVRIAAAGLKFAGLIGRGGVLSLLSVAFKGLLPVLTAVGGAIAAIGAAKLALVGAAVGVVAAAGSWLYRNWEGVSALLGGVADVFRDVFGPAIEAAKAYLEPFAPILDRVASGLSWLKESASGLGDVLKGAFAFDQAEFSEADLANLRAMGRRIGNAMVRGILNPFSSLGTEIALAVGDLSDTLYQAGQDLMNGLWEGMKSRFAAIMGGVSAFFDGIAARGRAAGQSPRAGSQVAPGRAFGGPVKAGAVHTVGEMGRELFVPDRDGFVLSNRELSKALGMQAAAIRAGGDLGGRLASAAPRAAEQARQAIGSLNVNLGGITISGVGDVAEAADRIGSELGRSLQGVLAGMFADEAR